MNENERLAKNSLLEEVALDDAARKRVEELI
jgi:hypothetical protein